VLLVEVLLLFRVQGSRWVDTRATTADLRAGLAVAVSWPAARNCIVAIGACRNILGSVLKLPDLASTRGKVASAAI
jgi:hypothetical protein